MSIGDQVWVAIPLPHSSDGSKAFVYTGAVVAFGDNDEVVVKHEYGIQAYGGPYSGVKVFASESEAWSHCGQVLRQCESGMAAAAAECEAKAKEQASAA